MSKPIPLPLVLDLKARDSALTKDQKAQNAYVEIINPNKTALVKRPGVEFHLQMPIA